MAVSYTHLDIEQFAAYNTAKRKYYRKNNCQLTPELVRRLLDEGHLMKAGESDSFTIQLFFLWPVSYTHLDVYKRQAGNRLAGRPAPSAFRCAFYFRGRRRADVFLRKAGKGIPASCSGAFRGRRTVVRCLRHNNEPSRGETRFAPRTRGANPLRSERRASGRTMGTPPAPSGTGQLHEILPSALGLLLRADIGTDDAVVLQVQLNVGI